MATRLYEHPIFLEHITPSGHPERPDRLRSLNIALEHPNFERLDRKERLRPMRMRCCWRIRKSICLP